jgi:hypothetical protein
MDMDIGSMDGLRRLGLGNYSAQRRRDCEIRVHHDGHGDDYPTVEAESEYNGRVGAFADGEREIGTVGDSHEVHEEEVDPEV